MRHGLQGLRRYAATLLVRSPSLRQKSRTRIPTPDPVRSRSAIAAVAALTILGATLRVYRLGHQSLWNDEVVTYISSVGTPSRVVTQRVENSNIPPLYYLVANTSLRLADPTTPDIEAALRLPSVVVGVLTIPLLFIVVLPWLGERIAVLATACLAISPFHVWYSQEARPYALLLALSLAAVACIQRALRDPDRWAWKAASAVALAATFYCHTVGVAFILFAVVYVAIAIGARAPRARFAPEKGERREEKGDRRQPQSLPRTLRGGAGVAQVRAWAVTFAAVAVMCVPAVYRLATFPPTNSADAERALSPLQLGYTLWSFVVGYSFGPSLGELHAPDRRAVVLHYAASVVPVAAIILVVMAWGSVRLIRRDARIARLLALWFLFPLLFVVLGALVTVHPFNVRYAVISFLPVVIILAVGLDTLPSPGLRAAGWAGLALLSAVALRSYYVNPKYARDDNRGAALFFASHAGPDELVLAHRAFTAKDFRFYAPEGTRIIPFPPADQAIASLDVDSTLSTIIGAAPRFWMFLSRSTPEEVTPLLAYCDHAYERDSAVSFESTGVQLIACVRRGASTVAFSPPTGAIDSLVHPHAPVIDTSQQTIGRPSPRLTGSAR